MPVAQESETTNNKQARTLGPTQEPMCRDDVIDIIYDNPLEKNLGVDGNSALTILGAAPHPPSTMLKEDVPQKAGRKKQQLFNIEQGIGGCTGSTTMHFVSACLRAVA